MRDFCVQDAEIAYQPGKVGPGRKQHVVIKGLGKKRGDADFDLVMSKVMAQVYGPLPEGEAAEQRWKETDVVRPCRLVPSILITIAFPWRSVFYPVENRVRRRGN